MRLKAVAGEFFKQGNFAKSAKVYQKINGWYNFGDASNNYLKEEGEEFETKNAQLMAIKQVCFTNLTVCKFKLQEWQSVVAITDQVLEMDPKAVKALWFRGKAYAMLKEWDNAIEALTQACKLDSTNADFRKELEQVKTKRLQEL